MSNIKKVLIIDDDKSTVEIVQLILKNAGYEISAETDGSLAFLNQNKLPDIIILDNKLGLEDGAEVCRKLKQNNLTAHIPVVMISATPGIEEIALNACADFCLPKPFSKQQLLQAIEKFSSYSASPIS